MECHSFLYLSPLKVLSLGTNVLTMFSFNSKLNWLSRKHHLLCSLSLSLSLSSVLMCQSLTISLSSVSHFENKTSNFTIEHNTTFKSQNISHFSPLFFLKKTMSTDSIYFFVVVLSQTHALQFPTLSKTRAIDVCSIISKSFYVIKHFSFPIFHSISLYPPYIFYFFPLFFDSLPQRL